MVGFISVSPITSPVKTNSLSKTRLMFSLQTCYSIIFIREQLNSTCVDRNSGHWKQFLSLSYISTCSPTDLFITLFLFLWSLKACSAYHVVDKIFSTPLLPAILLLQSLLSPLVLNPGPHWSTPVLFFVRSYIYVMFSAHCEVKLKGIQQPPQDINWDGTSYNTVVIKPLEIVQHSTWLISESWNHWISLGRRQLM